MKPINTKYQLNLMHLYPRSMNIYGDRGNILTFKERCQWRNIKINFSEIEVGQDYNFDNADIIFAGGGQDSNQLRMAGDLQNKKANIKKAVESGVVFLTICGTYQLFGHYFLTHEKTKIPGISVFDCITEASNIRKIGNVIVEHSIKGLNRETLVGFENHSGNTYIKIKNQKSRGKAWIDETVPLAKVIRGFGNNGEDGYEGARYKNCFGTYLHGSLLPKNPHFADYLIQLALERKYGEKIKLTKLDDELEYKAHQFILNRDLMPKW